MIAEKSRDVESPADKVLAAQQEELSWVPSTHTKRRVWWCMLVISALGRHKDPRGLLGSQLSQLCKF